MNQLKKKSLINIKSCRKIKCITSKNRKLVAGVTRATVEERHVINYIENPQLSNLTRVQKVADTLCSSLTEKDNYIRPNEELIKDLKEHFDIVDIIKSPREEFNTLPKVFREEVINKIYYSNCAVTKIVGYEFIEKDDGILLVGKCDKCGKDIARLMENL